MPTTSIQNHNEVFIFRRWWLLVSLHWAENKRRYLLSLLAIAGLLTAAFAFELYFTPVDFDFGPQFIIFYLGLYITGCLYGNTVFSALSHRRKAIQYLTFPASALEKLFCSMFFGVLLFFIAYLMVFYIVDISMVSLGNMLIPRRNIWPDLYVKPINVFSNAGGPIPNENLGFMTAFFAIQSAYILGSLYFPRYAFIKTSIAVFLFAVVTYTITAITAVYNLPHGWLDNTWNAWQFNDFPAHIHMRVEIPTALKNTLVFLLLYSWPLLFWLVTYYRLKEKEVR